MPSFSRKRVAPIESAGDIIEIRPSRYLRIQHHNARPRDVQFQREMDNFIQYKKSGIPSSGPLTMSKRLSNNVPYQPLGKPPLPKQQNSSISEENIEKNVILKNTSSINDRVKEDLASQALYDEEIITSHVNPSLSSSLLSTPTHGIVSDKIQSASSVLVGLRTSQRKSGNDLENSVVDSSASATRTETPLFTKTTDTPFISKSDSHQDSSDKVNNPAEWNNADASKHDLDHDRPAQSEASNGMSKSDVSQILNSDDVVLFFIHGVGGSSEIWSAQIDYFSKRGYEIVAPDLIGHGFSCCPKNARAYHFKEIAADMEELFDKYCKKRNVVIGHSYGASFATLLARTRSRRIHRLVLVSSGPPTPLAPQPGVFTLPMCMLGCIKPCLLIGFKKGAFYKKRKSEISKKNAFSIPTNVLQHMMNGQDWADGDELYHNWLTCQCLLIYGAEDQLVSLEEELETKRAIFNSRLEIVKDASHMVMMEAPNEINELLENFIKQTSSTQNQDHQCSSLTDSVTIISSIKRQKSALSLKSHKPRKKSHTELDNETLSSK